MYSTLLVAIFLLPSALAQGFTCECPPTAGTIAASASLPAYAAPPPACQTAYPAELRKMNSLEPDVSGPPTNYFEAMSQGNGTVAIGMQVQFQDIPPTATDCKLQLQLPQQAGAMNVSGPSPQIDIYQTAVAPFSNASWDTSIFNASLPKFQTLTLAPMVLSNIYRSDGLWKLNAVACNSTLTFQMGMRAPLDPRSGVGGVDGVNYWAWTNTQPPASPVQGWRIVFGC